MNGHIFEDMMIPIFRAHGFRVFSIAEFKKTVNLPNKYIVKDAPFNSIYNHTGKTEFLIVDGDRKIRVENKYQASAGSVDEKFVYTYINAVEAYPEKEIILVIDGGGYKPGARQWVVDAVNNNFLDYKGKGKSIEVMTIIEFTNWFNSNW